MKKLFLFSLFFFLIFASFVQAIVYDSFSGVALDANKWDTLNAGGTTLGVVTVASNSVEIKANDVAKSVNLQTTNSKVVPFLLGAASIKNSVVEFKVLTSSFAGVTGYAKLVVSYGNGTGGSPLDNRKPIDIARNTGTNTGDTFFLTTGNYRIVVDNNGLYQVFRDGLLQKSGFGLTYSEPTLRFYVYSQLGDTVILKVSDLNFYVNKTEDFNYASISYDVNNGFSNSLDINYANLQCNRKNASLLNYKFFKNGVSVLDSNFLNNTRYTLVSSVTNGLVDLNFVCTDLNNGSLDFNAAVRYLYASSFSLVDEQTGGVFDLSNVVGLIAHSLDSNAFYDLKTNSATGISFISTGNETIRFDFNYAGGTSFFKEFSISQLGSNTPVCAAKPQSFYQTAVVSVSQKSFAVKNNSVNCYSSNTFTKYAYSTNFYEPIYTISAPYYLYLVDGSSVGVLALLDGSRTDIIYLDVLASNLQLHYIVVPFEDVSFFKPDAPSESIIIYYKNWKSDSIQTDFMIYDASTSPIWSYSELLSPNDLNIIFDYSTLTIDKNILSLKVVKHLADGTTSTYFKYFNTQAQTGILNPVIPAILSIALMIFGLTMTSTRTSFGFVGIAVCIISLFILTLTPLIWYIGFLEGVIVLCFLYIVITFKKENLAVS